MLDGLSKDEIKAMSQRELDLRKALIANPDDWAGYSALADLIREEGKSEDLANALQYMGDHHKRPDHKGKTFQWRYGRSYPDWMVLPKELYRWMQPSIPNMSKSFKTNVAAIDKLAEALHQWPSHRWIDLRASDPAMKYFDNGGAELD